MSPTSLGPMRLSTNDLPPRERLDIFREEVARKMLCTEFVDHSSGHLRFEVSMMTYGPVRAGVIAGTPSRFFRPRAMTGQAPDLYSLMIAHRGRYRHTTRGESVDVPAGSAVLINHGRPDEFEAFQGGITLNLLIERNVLSQWLPHADAAVGIAIPGTHPTLALLQSYIRAVGRIETDDLPAIRETTGRHLLQLVAHTLGSIGSVSPAIEPDSMRAARRSSALSDLDRHATDPGLTIAALAHRIGVTPRYVQMLLEETGLTFSEHVLRRRLDAALRLLKDPRKAHLRITDIALEAGFSDLPYFNRVFRRRFGDTPTGVRALPIRLHRD